MGRFDDSLNDDIKPSEFRVKQIEKQLSKMAGTPLRFSPPSGSPEARSYTPPPPEFAEKRDDESRGGTNSARKLSGKPGGDPLNATDLHKALEKFEDTVRRHREVTPGGSPNRKRQRVYGDR